MDKLTCPRSPGWDMTPDQYDSKAMLVPWTVFCHVLSAQGSPKERRSPPDGPAQAPRPSPRDPLATVTHVSPSERGALATACAQACVPCPNLSYLGASERLSYQIRGWQVGESGRAGRQLRLRETDLIPLPPACWLRKQRTQVAFLLALNPHWTGGSPVTEFWNPRAERAPRLTDKNIKSNHEAQRGETLPQDCTAGWVC